MSIFTLEENNVSFLTNSDFETLRPENQGDVESIKDLCYKVFMCAKSAPNKDDGGPVDWFNDTQPWVLEQIAKLEAKHNQNG